MSLKAVKQQQFLKFTLESRELWFDLSDNKFKRPLKTGVLKEVVSTGVSGFFRKIELDAVIAAFNDTVYSEIVKRVCENEKRRENNNFATLFSKIHKYLHLESYLLLGIRLSYEAVPFHEPVSFFSKPVIRFMRESNLMFGSNWEGAYKKHGKLITDLCTYVMEKHHDDLLVYKHLHDIVTNNNIFSKFVCLTLPLDVQLDGYWTDYEKGFSAEYKALFDYVVRCIAVEAMRPNDVIQEYFDYLKMARKIKQLKHIRKLRESGDMTTRIENIGFVDYKKVEKYPKGLTIRHRIVTRNYDVMQHTYDNEKFRLMVNHDFAWESGDYCVVTATSVEDIKNEGTELNHCVGSYIDAVIQGRTQIVFLRKSETPDQSLVTVEIRSRSVQQARGYGNRELSEIEVEFLEKYAEAKNLTYGKVESNNDLPCPTVTAKKEPEVLVA